MKFWIKNCNIKYFDNKNVTVISNKKFTEVISSVEILNQEVQYKVHNLPILVLLLFKNTNHQFTVEIQN